MKQYDILCKIYKGEYYHINLIFYKQEQRAFK